MMAAVVDDNEALRSRIRDLEGALSASKRPPVAIPDSLMMTPTPFLSNDSVRSESVCKLVEALNRAAHEVETPKPWPRYGGAPGSVLKDSAVIMSSNANTLAAIDQSINRFNKRQQLFTQTKAGTTTDTKRPGAVELSLSRPDKMIELLNRLDAKEKQIITLTAENVQLKAKMSKMKSQLKSFIVGPNASASGNHDAAYIQSIKTGEEKENVGNSAELVSIQKVETMNTKLVADTQTRIDELKKEAEDKLTQAAFCVESLQKTLEDRTNQLKDKSRIIKGLEEQQAVFKLKEGAASSAIPATPIRSNEEEDVVTLKRKLGELTKLYNDSCKTQSEMKTTMGQAVEKLKQFMKELDEKTDLLNQSRQDGDYLKARIAVLERGSCTAPEETGGIYSSCFLANSYESKLTMDALDTEQFLLRGTAEDLHRTAYLRQAFSRMFQSKQLTTTEMQSLGRVVCSLLGITGIAQKEVVDAIGRISTAAAVSSGLLNVFSIFD
jgi:TolA-binding protein